MDRGKIVYITGALSQPRCIKRVVSLVNAGYPCVVYGFNRGEYDVNSYPEGIEVIVLGTQKNGNNLYNLITSLKAINPIVKNNGKDCLYYCEGFLFSLLLSFRKGIKYIYEIADILYAYPKYKRVSWILKILDKWTIKRSKLTVMTSGGFSDFFDGKYKNIIIQPNCVSPYFNSFKREIRKIDLNNIRFGFIGAIRYETVLRFARIIKDYYPQHEFHFFGGSSDFIIKQVHEIVEDSNNVKYHGPFKSPTDLPNIYDAIDVVVSCYDVNSLNERIAEPNKLYESVFFCKPIIVSANTYLAKRVTNLGCGYVIENSTEAIRSLIENIDESTISYICNNELAVGINKLIDNPSNLISKIDSIFQQMKAIS